MDTLEKIFGSTPKVKMMRLFLFNPQSAFDTDSVSRRTKTQPIKTRSEIMNLEKIGLIKRKYFTKELSKKGGRDLKRKRVEGWTLNEKFPFLEPLQNFLIHIPPVQQQEILEKIKKAGVIKLVIFAGVFIQDWDSRLDILVVGDKLKKGIIQSVMSDIESVVGKELKYSFFETQEFVYRLGVCDKLVRDVLDYPHKKIINKLEMEI